MKPLKTLLKDMASVDVDVNITGLSLDSRRVQKGDLFFATPGVQTDGRKFIADAIKRGAKAVVCESKNFKLNKRGTVPTGDSPPTCPVILIENLSQKISEIASRFYDHPSKDLWVIAITGTNGKTSCSYLLAQALEQGGKKTAVIGTLGTGLIKNLQLSDCTTPDPITLQRLLHDFKQQGVEVVVMEASSHALVQGRLTSVQVDIGVFTNLTRDHLDYHQTLTKYARAKEMLFEMPSLKCGIFNVDDQQGKKWLRKFSKRLETLTYGLHSSAQVSAQKIQLDKLGMTAQVITPWGENHLKSDLLGEFNLYNLLAVISVLGFLKQDLKNILSIVAQLKTVPGRCQFYGSGAQPTVVIDFAHTPDALEKILKAVRSLCHGKLTCIFGCGGDRDVGKRPLMGALAEKLADVVILTDDNVRFENPDEITRDILAGCRKPKTIIVEHDREKAIANSIKQAEPDDFIVVAGKGHEHYQIISDRRENFSDQAVVKKYLSVDNGCRGYGKCCFG